jgi:hypothetical protein
MFLDVRECSEGGINKLLKQLSFTSGSPVRTLTGSGSASSPPPKVPAPVYLRDSRSSRSTGSEANTGKPLNNVQSTSTPVANGVTVQATQPELSPAMPRFLLLCVNTRKLTTLVHVDLTHAQNDQPLFNAIRNAYWEVRNKNSWNISLLIPAWIDAHIKPAFKEWFRSLHVLMPSSADLVEVSGWKRQCGPD